MISIISKRPLLAIILAAGSPADFPMQSFVYRDSIGLLQNRNGRAQQLRSSNFWLVLIMILEYVVALGAVANVVLVSRELGLQAICTFTPRITYLSLLYTVLNLVIHISGAIALHLRVSAKCQLPYNSIFDYFRIHFTPVAMHRPYTITVVPENYSSIVFNWFTSILTVCHVLFGTVAFSSMLFISVRDSIQVVGRLVLSVMFSRIILMYELSTLRDAFSYNADSDLEMLNGKYSNVSLQSFQSSLSRENKRTLLELGATPRTISG